MTTKRNNCRLQLWFSSFIYSI